MSPNKSYRVLFLCTGNSARSIMAEALLNHRAQGRFEAYSAGAAPAGQINPCALETLRTQYGIDVPHARSKSWTEFAGQNFDFIITLCDKARESCPVWPGHPITAHWGSPDPAAIVGPAKKVRDGFRNVASQIAARINLFLALRDDQLDELRIREIGYSGKKE